MTTAIYEEKVLRTAGVRPPLVTRPLLMRFAVTLGASTSFYLLLSVVPLYASAAGAGGNAAGLATGALMFATVAGELVTPRLTARYGYRMTLAVGLVLLGAPALALTGPPSLDDGHGGLHCPRPRLRGHRGGRGRDHRLADPGRAPRRGAGPGRCRLWSARAGGAAGRRMAGRADRNRAGVRGRGGGRAGRPGGRARPAGRQARRARAPEALLPAGSWRGPGRAAARRRGRAADRRPAAAGHRVRGHHDRGRDHRHLRAARGDRLRRASPCWHCSRSPLRPP